MEAASPAPPANWNNIALMLLVHVAASIGLALYLIFHGLTLAAVLIGLGLAALTIFSISAGYHRLFSHRAYEAHPVLRLFLLVFGAGAFQNSVLAWSADHRRHHGHTDEKLDPYNAKLGFWHSHIGWALRKEDPALPMASVRDLERDPLIQWQHRRYGLIGIASGLVLPTLLGLAFGDPIGGFVVGAAVRLLVCYHVTFAINSLAHRLGTQPYSDSTTARDSFIVALLSMGEGYHNFHHTFPADYRNGAGRGQYDPTKWALWVLARLGLARHLKSTSAGHILRASLRMDQRRLLALAPSAKREAAERVRGQAENAAAAVDAADGFYRQAKADSDSQVRRQSRLDLRRARQDLARARRAWQACLQ